MELNKWIKDSMLRKLKGNKGTHEKLWLEKTVSKPRCSQKQNGKSAFPWCVKILIFNY